MGYSATGAKRAADAVRLAIVRGAIALLAVVLAGGLGGCRYSEALFEITVDPLNGEYEPNAEPEYKDVDGAPEDPTRASTHLSQTDNYTEQRNDLPVYGEDQTDEQADRTQWDATTNDTTEAVEGTEASPEEGEASRSEDEAAEGDGADGEGEGSDQMGDEGDATPDKTGGRGGAGQTYGDGSYEELPEARAIAAKGPYALIVQMLGGKGALAAADKEWLDTIRATDAFPGEGLDEVEALWSGKDNDKLDVAALVDTHADVVLVDGVECALSEKETKQLTEAGINVVSVPALGLPDTSDEDVATAIRVVAQLLSGAAAEVQYDPTQMADQWMTLHDDALSACVEANGGYSYKVVGGFAYTGVYQGDNGTMQATTNVSDNRVITAFVNEVVPASASTVTAERSYGDQPLYLHGETVDARNGVGLSVQVTQGNFVLMDYYLQTAGVVNNAYEGACPSETGSEGLTLPYAVIAGNSAGLLSSVGSRSNSSALWLPLYSTADWTVAGDEGFPGLLVRDDSVAEALEKSAAKVRGLYNVGQPYEIRTMPEGVAGSWADGTPESFLLAPWAFDVYQGGALDGCHDWIDAYYECFYRMEGASAAGAVANLDSAREALCPTS